MDASANTDKDGANSLNHMVKHDDSSPDKERDLGNDGWLSWLKY